VLNTPNDSDTGFEQRGLSLPVYNIRSLPNYPNYRLYDLSGSNCDSLGIDAPMVGTTTGDPLSGVSVFPNPFSDQIRVVVGPDLRSSAFSLFNPVGRLVLGANLTNETTHLTGITLPAGIYFWEIRSRGVRIKSGKLVLTPGQNF
jgi:hypothetical protein